MWSIASCGASPESVSGASEPTLRPSRSTVTRSPKLTASCSLCVMKSTAIPASRSRPMTRPRSSTPCGVSIEVASSRMSTLSPRQSALTISTSCCWPSESEPSGASSGSAMPSSAVISPSLARVAARFMGARHEAPSIRFSSTESVGTRVGCW